MSIFHRVLTVIVVVAAVITVIYFATRDAKGAQDAFEIPAPHGARFEVNGNVALIKQRERQSLIVTVLEADPQAKAKARWYYAGSNCQSVGTVRQALSEVQRCAFDAMGKK